MSSEIGEYWMLNPNSDKENPNSVKETAIEEDVLAHYPPIEKRVPYSKMIAEAFQSAPHGQLTFREIYEYVLDHYPYYRTTKLDWKVSNFSRLYL